MKKYIIVLFVIIFSSHFTFAEDYKDQIERSFKVSEGEQLNLKSYFGSINLKSWKNDK